MRKAIMINNVRRAYFYARATRDLYVEIPPEDDKAGPNVLGKLGLCLYEIRDAAKGWQEALSSHLDHIGFRRGIGHPAVFHHPTKDLTTLVHGDDYVSSGLQAELDWLEGGSCSMRTRSRRKRWDQVESKTRKGRSSTA